MAQPFAVRIKIINVEGAEIAYLHSREGFDILNLPPNNDGYQFLEIDKEFTYDGVLYKIKNINFVMMPFNYEAEDAPRGVNLYSPDAENQDFSVNCQVGIFVERI